MRKKKVTQHITEDGRVFTIPLGIAFSQNTQSGTCSYRLERRAEYKHIPIHHGLGRYYTLDHAFQAACFNLIDRLTKEGLPYGIVRSPVPGTSVDDIGICVTGPYGSGLQVSLFDESGNAYRLYHPGTTADAWNEARQMRRESIARELSRQLDAIPRDVVPVVLDRHGVPFTVPEEKT